MGVCIGAQQETFVVASAVQLRRFADVGHVFLKRQSQDGENVGASRQANPRAMYAHRYTPMVQVHDPIARAEDAFKEQLICKFPPPAFHIQQLSDERDNRTLWAVLPLPQLAHGRRGIGQFECARDQLMSRNPKAHVHSSTRKQIDRLAASQSFGLTSTVLKHWRRSIAMRRRQTRFSASWGDPQDGDDCRWMGATLDGRVEASGAVFEAKFMLPWSFSEEAAAEKYMPQLQHNMWVVAARTAVLSVITGGGKWVEIRTHADPLYQHLIVTAERKFWRCVESGEPPALFGVEPPKPRIEAVRIVDMTSSNAWAEFAAIFSRTRAAHLEHEQAKAELKSLVPEDAQQAMGHGVRAKRSKSGAISFDLVSAEETGHAAV